LDIDYGHDLEAFRTGIGERIRAILPDDLRDKIRREHRGLDYRDTGRWTRILWEQGGWSVPGWPVEHGGPGWTWPQQYLFERTLADCEAPPLNIFSAGMVGPALIAFGTEDQKARFLPGLANGDIMLCQGYSEPDAGSDLASLRCRAERDGDRYIINGTKIWTTDAHHANWMFGLFRTDSSGRKQHGITLLLLDMSTPGITLSPVLTFEGNHEVNQTYFENVRVPVENRIGEEHRGWGIGKYILGMERFGSAEVSRTRGMMRRLKAIAAEEPRGDRRVIDDPRFALDLARAEIALRAVELTEQRMLFGPGGPDAMGFEASLLKVRGTEVQQQVMGLMVEALGSYGAIDTDGIAPGGDNAEPLGPDAAVHAADIFYNIRKSTIWGGSTEVQKNIIAKAVLGL